MEKPLADPQEEHPHPASSPGKHQLALALGALGVVYGDIGTSPLYALRECFVGDHGLPPTPGNVYGILSLVFWSLLLIISVKYLVFILRADNRGEGGILAMMTLVAQHGPPSRRRFFSIFTLGTFGAALLYADAAITPAISVLSAVEGLQVATTVFQPYVVPLAVAILVGLFLFQARGTAQIGAVFGPIMLLWFAILSILGILSIAHEPEILLAADPRHAWRFFAENSWRGFAVLGTVLLVMTGGEALYADMGHFGRRPIQLGWFYLVFPALLLNYFGQGALLLREPQAVEHLFYHLVPTWGLYPMVALATLSTVIASQAVISGAFSLTRQAVQLGYSPRLTIRQTSSEAIGQVYLPAINWMLLVVVLGLVLSFRASGNLAAAYGVAVATTMLITTLFLYGVAHRVWGWSSGRALLLTGIFLVPSTAFFASTLIKVKSGGWMPLLLGLCIYLLMATWREGRGILRRRLEAQLLPLDLFIGDIQEHPPLRVPGIAVFLTGNTTGVPVVLLHNFKHNKVLHQTIVLLTVQTEEIPRVPPQEQMKAEALGGGLYRIVLRYGFSENPDIPAALQRIRVEGFRFELMKSTFFLGRENLIVGQRSPISRWRGALFSFMSHNALDATKFFKIPPNLVVELGIQVEL